MSISWILPVVFLFLFLLWFKLMWRFVQFRNDFTDFSVVEDDGRRLSMQPTVHNSITATLDFPENRKCRNEVKGKSVPVSQWRDWKCVSKLPSWLPQGLTIPQFRYRIGFFLSYETIDPKYYFMYKSFSTFIFYKILYQCTLHPRVQIKCAYQQLLYITS